MKRILITGANSYIGMSVENWLSDCTEFEVDTVDTKDGVWKEKSFKNYDTIFHVAGIAHADVRNVSDETKKKYYEINCDLAVSVARKAKEEGVEQFIFMSSIIVYGESAPYGKDKMLNASTKPEPINFYGDSKLQAEKGLMTLQDASFKVVIIRPPMIYGKGSKGNYQMLSKIAHKVPIFPKIANKRSMLHIDNLCEFIKLIIVNGDEGIFFPQNNEYVSTSDMVRQIALTNAKKIYFLRGMGFAVKLASKIPGKIGGLTNKAFGNLTYNMEMSKYEKGNYIVNTFEQSVHKTEGNERKRVLFLVNHDVVIYNFRLELVERLLKEGHEVIISSPYGERIDDLCNLGARYVETQIERHGTNPFNDVKVIRQYCKIIKDEKPGIVLTYTIKPNIYGGIAARICKTRCVANITGLGTAVEHAGVLQLITTALYKIAFRRIQCIFFQNIENKVFFENKVSTKYYTQLLPGSGVNLQRFPLIEYPNSDTIEFIFISRIMEEKGIEQYLGMAEYIHQRYPDTRFHICGFCEENYEERLKLLQEKGIVLYHGMIRNVSAFIARTHCTVHPSFYPEGMSNVCLESAACGRPVITTDRSGCKETVEDNVTGYIVKQQDTKDLIEKIEKFLALSHEERKQMGLEARKRVESEFDRQIVVEAYMREVCNE